MFDLRLLKYFLEVVDLAAGYTVGVETFYPVFAVLMRQALVDRGVERIAIHRAARLVAKALVADPLGRTERGAKALPYFGTEHRDVQVSVARLVHAGGNAGGRIVSGLAGNFAVDEPARSLKIHHVHHRLQQRGVQPL